MNVGYVLPVNNVIRVFKEEFEDTKGAIRIRISKKNDRTMTLCLFLKSA
jgi:hypothetical protein